MSWYLDKGNSYKRIELGVNQNVGNQFSTLLRLPLQNVTKRRTTLNNDTDTTRLENILYEPRGFVSRLSTLRFKCPDELLDKTRTKPVPERKKKNNGRLFHHLLLINKRVRLKELRVTLDGLVSFGLRVSTGTGLILIYETPLQ